MNAKWPGGSVKPPNKVTMLPAIGPVTQLSCTIEP